MGLDLGWSSGAARGGGLEGAAGGGGAVVVAPLDDGAHHGDGRRGGSRAREHMSHLESSLKRVLLAARGAHAHTKRKEGILSPMGAASRRGARQALGGGGEDVGVGAALVLLCQGPAGRARLPFPLASLAANSPNIRRPLAAQPQGADRALALR